MREREKVCGFMSAYVSSSVTIVFSTPLHCFTYLSDRVRSRAVRESRIRHRLFRERSREVERVAHSHTHRQTDRHKYTRHNTKVQTIQVLATEGFAPHSAHHHNTTAQATATLASVFATGVGVCCNFKQTKNTEQEKKTISARPRCVRARARVYTGAE